MLKKSNIHSTIEQIILSNHNGAMTILDGVNLRLMYYVCVEYIFTLSKHHTTHIAHESTNSNYNENN